MEKGIWELEEENTEKNSLSHRKIFYAWNLVVSLPHLHQNRKILNSKDPR
jgi:hypothetical protein